MPRFSSAVCIGLLYFAALSATSNATASQFTPVRVTAPFHLDATLGDPRWKEVAPASDFTDATSREPAHSATSAAIYYDARNLYVAFWATQDVPIVANQSTDNIGFGTDDYVGIGIDPSGNADRAYYFEITPSGTRFQQATESSRYTPSWQGAATSGHSGWTAMMIIPLRALQLSAGHVQAWRINLVRFVAHNTERLTWSYHTGMTTGSGFPALADARYWRSIHDLQIEGGRFRPTATTYVYALSSSGANRNKFITSSGTPIARNPRTVGVDIIYPLSPTISFVGTLNPDFSNVDADQLTITPQVFQRNLTEYRPFFSQGANFINNAATTLAVNEHADQVFYSPSIGTFDRGLKVEGTYGKYQSLGLLEARGTSDVTGQPFDDIAFGFKHVLPSRTFGYWTNGVVANHGGSHDTAFEVGAQARDLRTGWVGAIFHEREAGTRVTDPSESTSTYGFIDHQSANHEAILGFRDIGALYQPVDGFTVISDIHGPLVIYNWFGPGAPGSIFQNRSLNVFADRYLDRSGAVHKADAGMFVYATLKNKLDFTLSTVQTELRSYNGNFRTGFPTYINPVDQRFDQSAVGVGYGLSSSSPVSVQYTWGPFGRYFLQQFQSQGTRMLGRHYTISVQYAGTREKWYAASADGQWLRRISLAWAIDRNSTLSLALRDVSGSGGFASPGTNLSGSFHRVFE